MSNPESPGTFSIRSEHRNGVARLRAGGELDLAAGPLVEQALAAAEELQPTTIVLDLTDLTFIDSTGLHAVIRAHARASETGRILAVINSANAVRKVFEVSGVDRLFTQLTASPDGDEGEWSPIPGGDSHV